MDFLSPIVSPISLIQLISSCLILWRIKMGATVTTGKAVMGFKANNKVFYVLFEETYEKNCTPLTPRWNCAAIGEYKDMMKRVFRSAAGTEGGSLQNRANNLTPEMYIRGWSLAFNKVSIFEDREITLKILPRNYWRDGIESEDAGKLFTILKATNRLDIWEKLIGDTESELKLSVYDNIDLIISIFGTNGIAGPWRIIDPIYVKSGHHDASLLPPKKGDGKLPKSMTPLIRLEALNMTKYATLGPDGNYYGFTSDYEVIGDFINNQALDAEMMSHGLGVKNIQSFRETLDALPLANNGYDVFISKSEVQKHSYLNSSYNRDIGVNLEDAPELFSLAHLSLEDATKNYYSYTSCFVFIPKQPAKLVA